MQSTLSTPRAAASRRAAHEPTHLDAAHWRDILRHIRLQHPSLNRVWFDQLAAHELSNGMIRVTAQTLPQLNFLQLQGQQPFTAAAQAVTGRLVTVLFHCDQMPAAAYSPRTSGPCP